MNASEGELRIRDASDGWSPRNAFRLDRDLATTDSLT